MSSCYFERARNASGREPPEELEHWVVCIANGWTVAEIAESVDGSTHSVSRWLRLAGMPIQPKRYRKAAIQ